METFQQFCDEVKKAPTIWLQIEEIAARHPWGVMEDQLYGIIVLELATRTDKLPEAQVIQAATTTCIWGSTTPQFKSFFTNDDDNGLEVWNNRLKT